MLTALGLRLGMIFAPAIAVAGTIAGCVDVEGYQLEAISSGGTSSASGMSAGGASGQVATAPSNGGALLGSASNSTIGGTTPQAAGGGSTSAGAPMSGGVPVAGGGSAANVGGITNAGITSTGGYVSKGGAASSTGGTPANAGANTGGISTLPSTGLSCKNLAATCQQGESCCTSYVVPSGTFMMGRSTSSTDGDYYPSGLSDELPNHSVAVSAYRLDKYEVTVGRLRQFVEAYVMGWRPTAGGAGAHANILGSGWLAGWDDSATLGTNLPLKGADAATTRATFASRVKCDASSQTWTDTAGENELFPANCVNWYEALAFCIWDGGYLPTEAEWEYAAAGGDEERRYPWGSLTEPNSSLANYAYEGGSGTPYLAVGSRTLGHGRWMHEDLAGGMWEWNLDSRTDAWYLDQRATGSNVCNLDAATAVRSSRGGSWYHYALWNRATCRGSSPDTFRSSRLGVRCARP